MTLKNFILIGCSVLHMQLWRHNEGTYDVNTNHTHSPWGVLATCQVSIFSSVQVQRERSKMFPFFPKWLSHHVIYDIILIIITFHMRSQTCGENFVSIRQAVVEKKHESSVRTNKQTNRRTRRRRHAEHDACKIHKTNLTSKIIGGWIQWPEI